MIVLVTGSRDWTDRDAIRTALKGELDRFGTTVLPQPPTVFHGGARGADLLAGSVARELGYWVRTFVPDWYPSESVKRLVMDPEPATSILGAPPSVTIEEHIRGPFDRLAGFKRNQEMVDAALAESAKTGIPPVCWAFMAPCSKPGCRRKPEGHFSHGASDCAERARRAGITTHYASTSVYIGIAAVTDQYGMTQTGYVWHIVDPTYHGPDRSLCGYRLTPRRHPGEERPALLCTNCRDSREGGA